MGETQTISASDFKARCHDIFDRIASRTLTRVMITERGKIVAILSPPDHEPDTVKQLQGFMHGSVSVREGLDLTAPVEDGVLHA